MKYLLIIALLILIFLTGCSIPPFKPQMNNSYVTLSITIDNDIIQDGEKVAGLAKCSGEGVNRFCFLRVPSIEDLDDWDWYTWGKELGHAYYGNYHEGVVDIY